MTLWKPGVWGGYGREISAVWPICLDPSCRRRDARSAPSGDSRDAPGSTSPPGGSVRARLLGDATLVFLPCARGQQRFFECAHVRQKTAYFGSYEIGGMYGIS